jgi:hypothetical protein
LQELTFCSPVVNVLPLYDNILVVIAHNAIVLWSIDFGGKNVSVQLHRASK